MAEAPEIPLEDATATVRALLEAAKASRNPARNVALVRLMADVGIRPAEAANLSWGALLGPDGRLSGHCRWPAVKKGARRDVNLSPATLAALSDLLAGTSPSPQDRVFVSEFKHNGRNGSFSAASMTGLLRDLGRAAGLRISAYSLRHLALASEARAVIAAGGHGGDLLNFSGHKSLSSVQAYLDACSKTRAACDDARAQRAATY